MRDSISAIVARSPYDLGAELLQLSIFAEAEVDHFCVRTKCSRSSEAVCRSGCGERMWQLGKLAVAGGV